MIYKRLKFLYPSSQRASQKKKHWFLLLVSMLICGIKEMIWETPQAQYINFAKGDSQVHRYVRTWEEIEPGNKPGSALGTSQKYKSQQNQINKHSIISHLILTLDDQKPNNFLQFFNISQKNKQISNIALSNILCIENFTFISAFSCSNFLGGNV